MGTRFRWHWGPALLAGLLLPQPLLADVSGVALFQSVPTTTSGLDYGRIQEKPVRGARILLRQAGGSAVLAEGVTGEDGSFRLSGGGGELEVVLVAESVSPPIVVEDNTDGDLVWAVSFSPLSDGANVRLLVPSGWQGGSYDVDTRLAGPFAILDAARSAGLAFLAVRSASFPPLKLNWSPDNRPESGDKPAGQIGTSHWDGEELYILGKADVDTDEYDSHVIVHEWGHYFESRLSRADSRGGAHGNGDLLDARVAFSEGWGNALSAMVLFPDTSYKDSFGGGQGSGFGWDLEDNGNDPRPGWYSENSVQSILFDLFDSAGDRADRVSLGLGPIYDVLVGPQRTTRSFTTIFSFVAGLNAVSPGTTGAVDALVSQHGIVPIRDSFAADETNDGGFPETLPLYRVAEIGGGPLTLTFRGDQPSNWIGQNRYVGFYGNGSSVTVTATTSADVDLLAYDGGRLVGYSDNFYAGTESVSFSTQRDVVYVVNVGGFEAAGVYECTLQVTSP